MKAYRIYTSNAVLDIWMSNEDLAWFGDRMDEGASGAVKVPTRLYDKFRKITGLEYVKNGEIKTFLIDHAYGV
jgi:hypothetical protein